MSRFPGFTFSYINYCSLFCVISNLFVQTTDGMLMYMKDESKEIDKLLYSRAQSGCGRSSALSQSANVLERNIGRRREQ